MKICSLASGSKGNSTYIETKYYKILIDLGRNKKYIVDKLSSIGVNYEDIDYVFLTHTHDDHTGALKTFLKGHKAKLVITQNMFLTLKNLDGLNIIIYEDSPIIENLDIKAYQMSHDSGDIKSFVITEDNSSLVYITDTGYIKEKYFDEFKNKDAYFIECNHDIEMLKNGPYPKWLQARILSDLGHLSNNFTGIYLSKLISDKTKNIILLHLSEKNNTEDLAIKTVTEIVGNDKLKNIKLSCAKQDEVSEVIEI